MLLLLCASVLGLHARAHRSKDVISGAKIRSVGKSDCWLARSDVTSSAVRQLGIFLPPCCSLRHLPPPTGSTSCRREMCCHKSHVNDLLFTCFICFSPLIERWSDFQRSTVVFFSLLVRHSWRWRLLISDSKLCRYNAVRVVKCG